MVSPDSRHLTESSQSEGSDETAETIDPEELETEDVVQTADGEVIHEPTGLILDENKTV